MLFVEASPSGPSAQLFYDTANATDQKVAVVLLSSATEKCTGEIYTIESLGKGSIPLANCLNNTEVAWAFESSAKCMLVYSPGGTGCQLSGEVSQANLYSFFDTQVPGLVGVGDPVAVTGVLLNKNFGAVFRNSLIGLAVLLSLFVIAMLLLGWWKLSQRAEPGDEMAFALTRRRRATPKLKQSEINRFETLVWSGGDARECTICLEVYQNGEELRKLGCGHMFHKTCVDRWLRLRSASCPFCRTSAGGSSCERSRERSRERSHERTGGDTCGNSPPPQALLREPNALA